MTEYHGHTNHATWAVGLHLTNEHRLYLIAQEIAREAFESWEPPEDLADFYTDTEHATQARKSAAADELHEFVREALHSALDDVVDWERLLIMDLLPLNDVDWHDVAETVMGDEWPDLNAR